MWVAATSGGGVHCSVALLGAAVNASEWLPDLVAEMATWLWVLVSTKPTHDGLVRHYGLQLVVCSSCHVTTQPCNGHFNMAAMALGGVALLPL